jgi:hypothetical protein
MLWCLIYQAQGQSHPLPIGQRSSQSRSHVTTDGQSASLPCCQAPIWDFRPDFCFSLTAAGLLMWGALSDERTGLQQRFMYGDTCLFVWKLKRRHALGNAMFSIRNCCVYKRMTCVFTQNWSIPYELCVLRDVAYPGSDHFGNKRVTCDVLQRPLAHSVCSALCFSFWGAGTSQLSYQNV